MLPTSKCIATFKLTLTLKVQGYPQWSDCKDDLQLYKHDDFKVELSLLPWIMSFNCLFIDFPKVELGLQFQGIMNIKKQTV